MTFVTVSCDEAHLRHGPPEKAPTESAVRVQVPFADLREQSLRARELWTGTGRNTTPYSLSAGSGVYFRESGAWE